MNAARDAARTLGILTPTIYVDNQAVGRGTRAIVNDAISNCLRCACGAASHAAHAVESQARLAADEDGSQPLGLFSGIRASEAVTKDSGYAAAEAANTALWIARAVCYAHAPRSPFWYSIGHAAIAALDSESGRNAGGAAIEQYASALLDAVLETQ